jgi:hypothetical protein
MTVFFFSTKLGKNLRLIFEYIGIPGAMLFAHMIQFREYDKLASPGVTYADLDCR